MADLAYNAAELRELGSQLATIHRNLEGDKDLKSYNESDVAHHDVAEAIDDFVNDWDDKRNRLRDQIADLSEMATQSADEYQSKDRDVAASLTEGE